MTVLLGHRVLREVDSVTFGPDRGNAISVDVLEQILHSSDMIDVALTFDDGYRDNREILLPLLEKYEAAATIFVTTAFVDRSAVPLEYCLERALTGNDMLRIPGSATLEAADVEQKKQVYGEVRAQFRKLPYAQRLPFIEEFNRLNDVDVQTVRDLFLTWDDILFLERHPLISIGSHAHSHSPLGTVSAATAWYEMRLSKRLIESHLGRPITMFAYPYGSGTAFTDVLARAAGYRQVYSVSRASVFPWVIRRQDLSAGPGQP